MSTIRKMQQSCNRDRERDLIKSEKIRKFFDMIENKQASSDLSQ